MRITFPRLGNSHRYGRLLFQEMGIELVVPAINSPKGLERGSLISPEEICLPFKLMADNLLTAWEEGADTVIMPATMGPCRLGEYAELLKVILDRQGCQYRWILLDSVNAIGLKELSHRLRMIVTDSPCSLNQILRALKDVYRVIKEFEYLEAEARIRCGYEIEKGASKTVLRECRKFLEKAKNIKEAQDFILESQKKLKEIEIDPSKKPLKLLLTGEIYTSIEAFGNHNIEERLMDMGIVFEKRVSIGWWIDHTIVNPFGGLLLEKSANKHMPHSIGGYAKVTVKEVTRYKQGGFDGIIQVLPAGCMPEIVAKSVFDGLGRDEGLPVLTIIFDEMCGEAGYITRIEAFTDMLIRKREKQ